VTTAGACERCRIVVPERWDELCGNCFALWWGAVLIAEQTARFRARAAASEARRGGQLDLFSLMDGGQ
jgi:hypothetical protein